MVDDGPELTYGEWDRRSDARAHQLAAAGVSHGDRVVLAFDNRRWTEYAVAYLAVLKTGAVAVPLSPRFAPPELASVLDHCQPSAVVGPPDLVPGGWSGVVLRSGDVADRELVVPFDVEARTDDVAEILYTSGTTGTPKGVACSHEKHLGPRPSSRRHTGRHFGAQGLVRPCLPHRHQRRSGSPAPAAAPG